MATSIVLYAPVFLPGELPSLTEKPGRPQSTGSQSWTLPKWPCMHRCKIFLPVVALPQWELSVKVAKLLGLWGPWWHQVCRDTDCLHCGSCGPIRVFLWASCSWQSKRLFGQSFLVAPPVQALRGLSCLGSFSVFQCIRHIEGQPLAGVILCSLECQALKGAPWVGSYSVVQCIRHLIS